MRFARSLSILAGLLVAGGISAAETSTLTLERALASVENVNLNVLLSREAAVQAMEQSRLSRVGMLPIINGSASQRRSKSVPLTNTGVTAARPSNRFEAVINGNAQLFNLQVWSAARSARLGAAVAQADYQAVIQNIMADVAANYFTHLRNIQRREVLDANIARARALHELARNQLNAGIATQIDVTRAEAQLAQAEQARLQQATFEVESELLLKRAIGLDPLAPLQLEQFTVRRADLSLSLLGGGPSDFEKRADYLRAQKAVEQAGADVRTTVFQRLPSIGINGSMGRGAANFDDDTGPQWAAGITLSVPIFDGFRAGADRRIALSRQRSQVARLRNLELQISSELRLAAQDANSRNAQIVMAEKNVQLARDQLRLAQERYRLGVADNREVVEAQTQLAVAEDNMIDAVFQYNVSRVELARARGDVRSVLSEKAP